MRSDRHGQLRAGQYDSRSFDIGEFKVTFEVAERVDAVLELPFWVVPLSEALRRPETRRVRNELTFGR